MEINYKFYEILDKKMILSEQLRLYLYKNYLHFGGNEDELRSELPFSMREDYEVVKNLLSTILSDVKYRPLINMLICDFIADSYIEFESESESSIDDEDYDDSEDDEITEEMEELYEKEYDEIFLFFQMINECKNTDELLDRLAEEESLDLLLIPLYTCLNNLAPSDEEELETEEPMFYIYKSYVEVFSNKKAEKLLKKYAVSSEDLILFKIKSFRQACKGDEIDYLIHLCDHLKAEKFSENEIATEMYKAFNYIKNIVYLESCEEIYINVTEMLYRWLLYKKEILIADENTEFTKDEKELLCFLESNDLNLQNLMKRYQCNDGIPMIFKAFINHIYLCEAETVPAVNANIDEIDIKVDIFNKIFYDDNGYRLK